MSNTLRNNTQDSFTIILNDMLRDKNISFRAKGLYAYMASMSNGWNFTIKSIATQQNAGYKSVMNTINELKENGYLSYQKLSNGKGIYTLHTPNNDSDRAKVPKGHNAERAGCKNGIVQKEECIKKNNPLRKTIDNKNNNLISIDEKEKIFNGIWGYYNIPTKNKGSKKKSFEVYIKKIHDKYTKKEIALVLNAELAKDIGQRHLVTIFNNFDDSLNIANEILNEQKQMQLVDNNQQGNKQPKFKSFKEQEQDLKNKVFDEALSEIVNEQRGV